MAQASYERQRLFVQDGAEGRGEQGKRGERFFLGAIAPPQAAEGAQFCKLPPETRACRKAVARGVQGKNQRRLRCAVKVKLIKLEGGRVGCVRAPWQGKFCVPGSAQAPSVPLNISPSVVLRTPCADLRSACRGGVVGCGKQNWLTAVVGKIGHLIIANRYAWQMYSINAPAARRF